MNIEKKQIDELDIQLTLTITKDDYAQSEKKMLNERRRNADLKGFRKGMAPMSLIQRMYGDQALYEAINRLISDSLNKFIEENNLKIVGEPLQSEDQPELEWKSGNDFTFKFDLATTPEIKAEATKDDKIAYYTINVTEQAKKEMKANMLSQLGTLVDAEAAKEEDFVIADFKQEGGINVEKAYVAVKKVEGEAKKSFVGAKVGDSFEVNVNEAFIDETDRASMLKIKKEELASINPVFTVSVVEVKTFKAAEESQETYDKLFGKDKVKSAEEFDAAVEEQLKLNYKQEADARLAKDIRNHFVEKAAIALPEAFLKRWLFQINEGKFTMEDIEKDFPAFLEDYRWKLVRTAFLEKYNIKLEEKDLIEAAEGYAAYQYAMYGMGNVPQEMISEFAKKILSDERQARSIYDSLEEQKVIEAVRPDITLSSKKISVEKFRELN